MKLAQASTPVDRILEGSKPCSCECLGSCECLDSTGHYRKNSLKDCTAKGFVSQAMHVAILNKKQSRPQFFSRCAWLGSLISWFLWSFKHLALTISCSAEANNVLLNRIETTSGHTFFGHIIRQYLALYSDSLSDIVSGILSGSRSVIFPCIYIYIYIINPDISGGIFAGIPELCHTLLQGSKVLVREHKQWRESGPWSGKPFQNCSLMIFYIFLCLYTATTCTSKLMALWE